jgi:hypothetical protein
MKVHQYKFGPCMYISDFIHGLEVHENHRTTHVIEIEHFERYELQFIHWEIQWFKVMVRLNRPFELFSPIPVLLKFWGIKIQAPT